jgi:hypothetical protein
MSLQAEVAECTFQPSVGQDGVKMMTVDEEQIKSFVKRNIEDYERYKAVRLEAKASYFYRDLRPKPQINDYSRKIVARSVSANKRLGVRSWAQKSTDTGRISEAPPQRKEVPVTKADAINEYKDSDQHINQ